MAVLRLVLLLVFFLGAFSLTSGARPLPDRVGLKEHMNQGRLTGADLLGKALRHAGSGEPRRHLSPEKELQQMSVEMEQIKRDIYTLGKQLQRMKIEKSQAESAKSYTPEAAEMLQVEPANRDTPASAENADKTVVENEIQVNMNPETELTEKLNAESDLTANLNAGSDLTKELNAESDLTANLNAGSDLTSKINAVAANVSFSAYMDTFDGIVDVMEGDPVLFTELEHASGGNFNPSTSYFTCSVRGVHYFTASLGVWACTPNDANDPNSCRMSIVRNTVDIAGAAMHETAPYSGLSMSVVTECSPGDHVFVRMRYGAIQLEGSAEGRETRFSGFLLYEV